MTKRTIYQWTMYACQLNWALIFWYKRMDILMNPCSIVVVHFVYRCNLQVTVEGQAYHKSCFKCSHGGCPISPSNYAALEGILYCKHHFSQLFKEKGSYSHLIKSASIRRSAAPAPDASWPECETMGTSANFIPRKVPLFMCFVVHGV